MRRGNQPEGASLTDPAYAAWIRQKPCHACESPLYVELHHATIGSTEPWELNSAGGPVRGKAQKAHDSWGIPLCLRCHRNFHSACGQFKDWDRQQRRKWQEDAVAMYRGAYLDTESF